MSDALHQSLYRVLSLLIAILPGNPGLLCGADVFTLLGMGISALLRRGLAWIKADERFARTRHGGGLDAFEFAHGDLLPGARSGPACCSA